MGKPKIVDIEVRRESGYMKVAIARADLLSDLDNVGKDLSMAVKGGEYQAGVM